MIETLRQKLLALADYERFERIALRYTQLLLAAITVFAIVLVTIDLVRDFGLGEDFMDKAVLQDTFGSVLIILILLVMTGATRYIIGPAFSAMSALYLGLVRLLI